MHDEENQFWLSVGKPQEIYLAGFNLSEIAVQTTELAGNQDLQRSQYWVVKTHCRSLNRRKLRLKLLNRAIKCSPECNKKEALTTHPCRPRKTLKIVCFFLERNQSNFLLPQSLLQRCFLFKCKTADLNKAAEVIYSVFFF